MKIKLLRIPEQQHSIPEYGTAVLNIYPEKKYESRILYLVKLLLKNKGKSIHFQIFKNSRHQDDEIWLEKTGKNIWKFVFHLLRNRNKAKKL